MANRKNDKRRDNDQQNITQKNKDRAARNPLKTGGKLMCAVWVSRSRSTSGTRRVPLVTNPV